MKIIILIIILLLIFNEIECKKIPVKKKNNLIHSHKNVKNHHSHVRPIIKKGKNNNKKKHVPVKPSIMKGKNIKKNIYIKDNRNERRR